MATYEDIYRQIDMQVNDLNTQLYVAERTDAIDRRMIMVLGMALTMGLLFVLLLPKSEGSTNSEQPQTAVESASIPLDLTRYASGGDVLQAPRTAFDPTSATGILSPVFTPEVRHWANDIFRWSAAHGLDPNIIATVMQVESCGDPQAMSGAGAMGLFQVMPFHFTDGEDMLDPDTNARRGMNYLVERLEQTNGDLGRSFAGYNGGHVAAATTWDNWYNETQRYYVWTTGIMNDIQAGLVPSPTIESWLQAGGASLCRQAAARLEL